MARSSLYRIVAVGLVALLVAGCGFHLRGEMPGTAESKTLFLTGLSNRTSFYGDLVQVLGYSGGILAAAPAKAGAVVNVTLARHERRALTLSGQGRANTFDLTFRVIYDVRSPKGDILVPQQEMEVRRDYFNDQSSPLGQQEEEALMRNEMEKEAAQTLLRRVVYTLNRKPSAATDSAS
jgi:LPS-assembly lipoprotein